MVKTKQQRRRDRKLADPAVLLPQSLIAVASVVGLVNHVTVTFASQVQLAPPAVPSTWFFGTGNQQPLSITAMTATSVTFLMPGLVAAGQPYSIGGFDPAVRTPTGGYVGASIGVMV